MTATSGADAAPTVSGADLAALRQAMLDTEPSWPHVTSELARHLQTLLPLVAGTVQAADAEHELYEYTSKLDRWHRASDRYFAAFDKTVSVEA